MNTCYKELLSLLEEVNIYDEEETSMDQFYNGLNEKIANMLADQEEIRPCKDVEKNAIKIERLL